MKNLAILIFTGLSFFGFAQKTTGTTGTVNEEQKKKRTAEERASHLADKMTTKLGLTEDQKAKVYAVNLEQAKKNDEIRANENISKEDRRTLLKSNYEARRNAYKSILTAEQFNQYEAWEKEKREKRQAKKQGKEKPEKVDAEPDSEDEL